MLADSYDWGEPIAKDVFLWGKGESDLRTATKIGGLPYRASGNAWPIGNDGRPLPFIGQVNFTNSTDIISVPGDILLVFADIFEDLVNSSWFEWQSIGQKIELVRPCEIPEFEWTPYPFHGYITRVTSYPHAVLRVGGDHPTIGGKVVGREHLLLNYQATEIGGLHAAIQPYDFELNGLLCVIASLQPAIAKPFPWVNQATRLDLDAEFALESCELLRGYPNHQLMFGDGGSLYIYRDLNDVILAHVSGH